MRKHIIDSIREKVANFTEGIARYDSEMEKQQSELARTVKDEDVTIENIVAFKSGFTSVEEIDAAIKEVDNQISQLEGELEIGAIHGERKQSIGFVY